MWHDVQNPYYRYRLFGFRIRETMKYLLLFLTTFTLNFSFPLDGCKFDDESQNTAIYYEHNVEIRDVREYIKMPTAYYQLVIDTLGETNENGDIISFPTWKGVGICMMNEQGKFVPYNISNQIYPSFSFLKIQEMQLNLDGTIREQAVFLKRNLDPQPKPSGEANWKDGKFYQAGKELPSDDLIQKKQFQKLYPIQQKYLGLIQESLELR